ncbi:MAG: hypothetical protein Q9162_005386 [Coniocarpon cinnabarinum]
MASQWAAAFPSAATLVLLLAALPGVSLANDTAAAFNDGLVWGPYRPNVYFGVRPRLPNNIFTGLLWANVDSLQTRQDGFRHTCEQNDGMDGYGWEEYNVRTGGRQTMYDASSHLDVTTQFVKVPGGSHGGNWGVRVNGKLRDDAPAGTSSTVLFYVAQESLGALRNTNEHDERGYEGSVFLEGETTDLGQFKIEVTAGPSFNQHPVIAHPLAEEKPLDRTQARAASAPFEALWQVKTIFFGLLRQGLEAIKDQFGEENPPPAPLFFFLSSPEEQSGNLQLIQKTFRGSWQFDILYSSKSAPEEMTSDTLSSALKDSSTAFNDAFKERIAFKPPFDKPKYDKFGKSLFSNLLGGIGYFHGDQVIDRSYASEYEEDNEGFWEEANEAKSRNAQELQGPYSLFTSVPSRPFFPRGFLWDEGFHLLPIADFDPGVALEIIKSWFETMDEDGWIPREQILGPEARSKVPQEFQVQYPHYANPPTLFLTLEHIVRNILLNTKTPFSDAEREAFTRTLAHVYPLLKRNLAWYRKTQRGDLKSYDRPETASREAYRWRGRTPSHIFTSGLDDYPRAQPPHPGELHLDLISWMGMASRSMKHIATYLVARDSNHPKGEVHDMYLEDRKMYLQQEYDILQNVPALHWSEPDQAFCDATVDEYEETVHVCRKGYVSLFPFLTGLMTPNDPHMGAVLDLIASPEHLWSNHGIRSLSKQDERYGSGENYWRSPIWVNINYLILQNLRTVALSSGDHAERAARLFNELRRNLVETVFQSWKETGFAWEQYNPDDGRGQRTQHFTGWTALVMRIMTMGEVHKAGHGEL